VQDDAPSSPHEADDHASKEWAAGSDALRLTWTFDAHSKYVLSSAISPDTTLLCTTSADGTACVWALPENAAGDADAPAAAAEEPWRAVHKLTGHQRWVWGCAFSECSRFLVTASSDHTSRLWDLTKGGALATTFSGHQKSVTCVVLSEVDR
jgi:G protein beta subunit-like protein